MKKILLALLLSVIFSCFMPTQMWAQPQQQYPAVSSPNVQPNVQESRETGNTSSSPSNQGTGGNSVTEGRRHVTGFSFMDPQDLRSTSEDNLPMNASGDRLPFEKGDMRFNLGKNLQRFGIEFFNRDPSTFAPLQNISVGPDYVAGPGDEVLISLWGFEENQFSATIARDGTLSLPQAGVIGAAGMTFSQLQKAIEKAYSRYFTNFEINVTMGRLQTITVYVVGEAQNPGAYSISSLSTAINALLAAGGPALSGTMRNIEVRRRGKIISRFDMYDLLLHGDKTKDLRLMTGDVIFIPHVGPLAGITGNVKHPAIYELKRPRIRLKEIIDMAGGITSQSYKGRVQVIRVKDHLYRTAFESDLANLADPRSNLPVQDGDLVKVYAVPEERFQIRLTGAVHHPGTFAIQPGVTRVRDVVTRAGGLLYTSAEEAEISRIHVTPAGPRTERFTINMKRAMQGGKSDNIALQRNDYISIHNIPEWELYRTVSVRGEVKYPGIYPVKKGETLSSLIERTGGYTDKAFLRGSVFTRERTRVQQQKSIDEMIDRLEREVYSSASEAIATSLSREDVDIARTESEQKQRLINRLRQTRAAGRVVIKLPENYRMLKGSPYDIQMEDGDQLLVPERPQTIHVIGAVYTPTSFVFRPDQTYPYYVRLAGGYSINADRKRVYIIRADGSSTRGIVNKRHIRVNEGDTVVVPEKIMVKSKLRDTRDIIDIIYRAAVSVAVVDDILDDD